MEKLINIATNASEVIGQFERIQGVAQRTGEVINAANKLSGGSFDRLGGSLKSVAGAYADQLKAIGRSADAAFDLTGFTQRLNTATLLSRDGLNHTVTALKSHAQHLGLSRLESLGLGGVTERLTNIDLLSREGLRESVGVIKEYGQEMLLSGLESLGFGGLTEKLTDIDLLSREGLLESVDVIKEYGQEMLLSGLESLGFGGLTEKLTDIDLFSREGFKESIGVLGNYAKEMKDNAIETFKLLDVRNSMTDADGNFCLQAAKMTALTIFSTIMKYKDKLATVKTIAMRKKESIATKAGAKVDAVGAKAKLALTAAKPFIGPIMVAAAGIALGAGIALLVRKLRTPAMATGGVVSAPTMALVGEGQYPEAVVPLGSSPQFASMKADIASAVVQAMSAVMGSQRTRGGNTPSEIALNIDGTRLARVMLPNLANEQKRVGYNVSVREV